jgi:hypothetical protein
MVNDAMKSSTETLIKALRILAVETSSEDGVANTAIAEAADRLEELDIKLTALGSLAVADWDDSTVGEVDKVVNSHKTTYNDQLRTLFTTNPEKIKKLEQENAELRTALNTALAVEFIDDTTIVELVERLIKIKKDHATTAR